MYNKDIISTPIVLFLGAGASRPFGKMMMGEFIDHLHNQDGFKNEPLFNDIVNVPGGRDLEHLFQELDEWSRKAYHPVSDQIYTSAQSGSPLLSTYRPPLVQVATRMIENLRKEVFNAYRDIQRSQREELVRCFGGLFGTLFRPLKENPSLDGYPLVVFTTNYDPAIEIFCQAEAGEYRLSDGFVAQPNAGSAVWHRESIDRLQLKAGSRKEVVLFKLHGSTSWFKRETEFIKSEARIYAEGDPSFENLLIYPAKRKVALGDPYFTAYDYFQRTLENCRLCVAIGYSFRDYDALSRLHSAASYNAKLKVLVVDPDASSLCQRLREMGVTTTPVPKLFGFGTSGQEYLDIIEEVLSANL